MNQRIPQLIIMLSGAVLIAAGLGLVVYQISQFDFSAVRPSSRSFESSPQGGIKLQTTYVGLVVIAMGAMLEMIGFLASRPWRNNG